MMARVEFRLPKLGMTMQEATIEEWRIATRDRVEEGQELCVIYTDKVDTTLEAPVGGVISDLLVAEGEVAEPGDVLAIIETSD